MRTALAPLLALTVALGGSLTTAAQSSPDADAGPAAALRGSLDHVPADPGTWRPTVSWVDLRAVADARPGAARPTSIAEVPDNGDDPAFRLWFAAMMGVTSGPADLLQGMLRAAAAWPETVGFDAAQLDRLTAFGEPPVNGVVAEGRFDAAAIGSAFESRGFVGRQDGDRTWWCSPDGCDAGMEVDLANADPGDPFGGRLGRRQPLAVLPDALLSSASDAVVASMVATAAGEAPALADIPLVTAVLDALDATTDVRLIQAELVPGTELALDVAALLGPNVAPERADELLATIGEGFEPLASASMLLIADGATASEQVVRLVLGYPTLADAERAAQVVPTRLATMPSIATEQPWQALLDRAGVSSVEGSAVGAGDGTAAAVITLRAPLASADPDPDTGDLVPSSRLYALFVRALWMRDLAWLAPALGEPAAG